jgi:peptidoglycan-associated lipoprotein
LAKNPGIIVKLRSHTDNRGSNQANMKLSKARAQTCVDFLVKEKNIDPRRLVAEGRGEEEPLPGCSEADIKAMKTKEEQNQAHQKNRRTDFKIISFDFDPTK